jgi:hypothetical protein
MKETTNPKLIRATRRARARWEDAHSKKVEAFCAIRFDQAAAAKAIARANETCRLYEALDARRSANV